ncbi:MAG: T9SS type A sorting domain-containing protein [Lewinellaceae bacterium]|nr:T9SS type A sorting domain-containing protein [Lewinellaceae bacterium]
MNLKSLRLLFPILLGFCLPSANAQCEYRLEMADSFGDGWDAAALTITTNGVATTYTLDNFNDDGTDSTVVFLVTDAAPLTFSWTQSPFYNSECSFEVYDYNGNLVYGANNPGAGIIFSGAGSCPSCLKPIDVIVDNVYDTRAKLKWTPVGATPGQQWLVIYGPVGFNLASGVGDTILTPLPKLTLTGLQKKTGYDFYVVQDCGNDEYSDSAGPFTFETYWSNDVGIAQVLAPLSGCDLGVEKVTIIMKNHGALPQSLVPFSYSVNGTPAGVGQPDDGFFTGVLGKDSCETIEFETMYDFSAPGEYLITVFTQMTGDEDMTNDTFFYRIVNRLEAPYSQNFDDWGGGWFVDSTSVKPSWEFGKPAGLILNSANSGVNAWVTNLDGAYNGSEHSYLSSPCFDFSNETEDPVIEFAINYNMEKLYEGCALQTSLDGGATWTTVGAIGEGLNWYNETNTISGLGVVWSGNSNGWKTARHSLTGTAGLSEVRLRFLFGSDPSVNYEGIAIDDIKIYVPLKKDLAGLSATTTGQTTECGLEQDKVIFTLTNFGTDNQGLFKAAYTINGGPVVEGIIGTIVSPDEVYTYTFPTTFDSRDGEFMIKCWTQLVGEQNPFNDTVTYYVSHLPRPVPFQENFESMQIPSGWTSPGFVTNSHNNNSYVLAFNLYSFNSTFNHVLPRYGFLSATDTLKFDYRITNYSAGTVATVLSATDHIDVQISTDCGSTYQTIYTINSTTHTPMVGLKTVKLGLGQYAGEAVRIRFAGFWGVGDYWVDFDNINILACPASMQLTATTTASNPGMPSGSATVTVGIGNAPYTYLWSDGQTTATATNLPVGQASVTVTDALGCTDMLTVSIGNTSSGEIEGLTELSLRPNPTSGTAWLTLRLDHPADIRVQAMSMLGQIVWEANNSHSTDFNETLGLDNMPDGLYLIRITVDGKTHTEKLIKSSR